MYNPNLPLSSENYPGMTGGQIFTSSASEVLAPSVAINPVTGILQPVTQTISPATPDLSTQPIIQAAVTPVYSPYADIQLGTRPNNIPDSVWNNMIVSYNNAVSLRSSQLSSLNNQQQLQAASDIAAAAAKDAADKVAANATLSQQSVSANAAASQAAIAASILAAQNVIIATQPKLDPVTQAMQTVWTTMDAADTAKKTADAAGINVTPEQLKEVVNTSVASVVAMSNASDVGADLPVIIQTQAADNAAVALNTLSDAGITNPEVITLPVLPDNHLPLAASDGVNAPVINSDNVLAVITKVQTEGEQTDKAAASSSSVSTTSPTVTTSLGWFDRLINYIYNKLYA
jgi:hypothetical protein